MSEKEVVNPYKQDFIPEGQTPEGNVSGFTRHPVHDFIPDGKQGEEMRKQKEHKKEEVEGYDGTTAVLKGEKKVEPKVELEDLDFNTLKTLCANNKISVSGKDKKPDLVKKLKSFNGQVK